MIRLWAVLYFVLVGMVAARDYDVVILNGRVMDPETDLHAPIAHGTGQTILREALLVADHNAYHLGQFMLIQKALGGGPRAEATDLDA